MLTSCSLLLPSCDLGKGFNPYELLFFYLRNKPKTTIIVTKHRVLVQCLTWTRSPHPHDL